jgi:hypothetical protein
MSVTTELVLTSRKQICCLDHLAAYIPLLISQEPVLD